MPTAIEWTDETASFWWGCTKVSEACKHCYAEGISHRFAKNFGATQNAWGKGAPRVDMRAIAETKLAAIVKAWKKKDRFPRVFINSMSDWLDDEVPIEWLADLLWTLHRYPEAAYQLLTKRPHLWQQRLKAVQLLSHPAASLAGKWLDGEAPSNFWIGTTVESPQNLDRLDFLKGIPARIRFISAEPLLADLGDITPWFPYLHWIIAGGESGTDKNIRPTHPDWIRSLRNQAEGARVPFFFKQWGAYAHRPEWAHIKDFIKEPWQRVAPENGSPTSRPALMFRVGKKNSGRLLGDIEHNAFPL